MGKMVNVMEIVSNFRDRKPQVGWSLTTYPAADPAFTDDRPKKVATVRMVWREDGRLAAAVGHEYAIEDEPLLIAQDDYGKPEASSQGRKGK